MIGTVQTSAAQSVFATPAVQGASQAPQAAETASASAKSRYEQLAQQYDVRSMTPYEVDELAEQLPTDGPGDMEFKLMLLTHGAEFQRHLQESLREAGILDVTDAEIEAKLSQPVDLIEVTENQIKVSRSQGDPTEAQEAFLARLHGFEARGYLPAGGVTV